jgi:hypothetical protein
VAELDADGRFRKSGEQRILIELLLLRFAYLERTVTLEEVLAAVSGNGGASAAPPGNGSGGRAAAEAPPVRRNPVAPPSSAPAAPPPRRPEPQPAAVAAPPVPQPSPAAVAAPPAPEPVTVPARETRAAAPAPETPPVAPAPAVPAPAAAAPPAPRPEPEPLPSADGPLDPVQLRRAWKSLMEDGEGMPPGVPFLLKSAAVAAGPGGEVRVTVPPASPVLDRLSSPAARKPLEEALGRRLGRRVSLAFTQGQQDAGGGGGGTGTGRITAESARRDRLRRLTEEEPLLAVAVQEWDLDLVD